MTIFMDGFSVKTESENQFTDITGRISGSVSRSGLSSGIASIFLLSTTSSLIICENEGGLLEDIVRRAMFFAPDDIEYRHNKAWGDNNGRSHVKATLYRQDLTVPVRNGELLLGTWQSIFLLEFDVRPRERRVSITMVGDV
ncbi:hypothetical protein IX51_02415 [uncultured archaeon]|nr:hypothetical protein IX51_02415 [uncultured archaeon]